MVYRKGERPLVKEVRHYNSEHPVAAWIADGDHWLTAWVGQMCTPWSTITKNTGITRERIEELNDGAESTPEEIEKLATIWWVTSGGCENRSARLWRLNDRRPPARRLGGSGWSVVRLHSQGGMGRRRACLVR